MTYRYFLSCLVSNYVDSFMFLDISPFTIVTFSVRLPPCQHPVSLGVPFTDRGNQWYWPRDTFADLLPGVLSVSPSYDPKTSSVSFQVGMEDEKGGPPTLVVWERS